MSATARSARCDLMAPVIGSATAGSARCELLEPVNGSATAFSARCDEGAPAAGIALAPARRSRDLGDDERLLHIDPRSGRFADLRVRDLPSLLRPADLLVVNDAATLPASLSGRAPTGEAIELRLSGHLGGRRFAAVLFGAGDWRTPTEHRPLPPRLHPGDRFQLDGGVTATLDRSDEVHPRLVEISIDTDAHSHPHSNAHSNARTKDNTELRPHDDPPWEAIYRAGRPVQYSYLDQPLPLYAVQTRYASRPWAMELPSAGRPLSWEVLGTIRSRGVAIARLTHAAGLSSTGDPAIDARLPFPERYDLPKKTVSAIARARSHGGRVIAVGTSVTRALEAAAARGPLTSGEAETDLVIRRGHRLRVVDGLLTGLHDPTASHFDLLQAFAPAHLLDRAYAHAAKAGYLCHEFGDSNLILAE